MPTLEEVQSQLRALDGTSQWLAKKEIKALPSVLWEDERITGGVQGFFNNRTGLLVATDRRLIFVDKRLLGGLSVEDFPYDKITSIQYETGLVFGKIRIYASGNRSDIQQIYKQQVQPFAETVRARISGGGASPTSAGASSADDDLGARLARLAQLHADGLLTAEEFAAAKAKTLGG